MMKTSHSNKFIRSASSKAVLSNTLYLTKIKPTHFSPSLYKASTDDLTFGASELKEHERKYSMKKLMQTQHIWYKAPNNNIYDTRADHNHRQIKDIKGRVRTVNEQNPFDLRAEIEKKKYFSLDYVDAIYESEAIRKKLQVKQRKPKEIVDIYTFRKQSKETCLRNNMINLLKSEMNKVSNKERDIQTALSQAMHGMERDMKQFDDLVITQKRTERERVSKLNEASQYNKSLAERKRELTLKLKVLQEEIGRTLREIGQYKLYADFIHLTFNFTNEMAKVALGDMKVSQRDFDYAPLIKKVTSQFEFLDRYADYHPRILDNPGHLVAFFAQVDGNIRKALTENNALIDDLHHTRLKYDEAQRLMEQRENKLKLDLATLSSSNGEGKDKHTLCSSRYAEQIRENTQYINLLFNSLRESEKTKASSTKNIRANNIDDVIKECLSVLYRKELLVNERQEELTEIHSEQPELFKSIVDKIKQENKKSKQIELKEIAKKCEENRKMKYLQRMTRYKPHGGVVFPPPEVLSKRKCIQNRSEVKQEMGYTDVHY